jgi:hypothetical protein
MEIKGLSLPEPHRALQEHAMIKSQLDALRESPSAQIEWQLNETRRLIQSVSLAERVQPQAQRMELTSRVAAATEMALNRMSQMMYPSHAAAEAERILHKRYRWESQVCAGIELATQQAAALHPRLWEDERLPNCFPSLLRPSSKDRINKRLEEVERRLEQLESKHKPPPPRPSNGKNDAPGGQYL